MNVLRDTTNELDQWDWNKDDKYDDLSVDLFTGDPIDGVAVPDGILDQFANNNPLSLSQLYALNAAWDKLATPFMRAAFSKLLRNCVSSTP